MSQINPICSQEVKTLAGQTAQATEEISAHISNAQIAAQDSVTAIKEIGAIIGQISAIASTIAAAIEQQGGGTQQIAHHVQPAAASGPRWENSCSPCTPRSTDLPYSGIAESDGNGIAIGAQ